MSITLNQIKKKLVDYFNSHAQVKEVVFANENDFAAIRNLGYPVVNIEYLDSSFSNRVMNHSYKIMIADLVDVNNKESVDEIHSDTMLIAEDAFAWLNEQTDFNFQRSSSIQNFNDDNGDRTAGIVFRIVLQTIRPDNACQIPYKS